MRNQAGREVLGFPVEKVLQGISPDCMKEHLPEPWNQVGVDDLFGGSGSRLLPLPATERKVHVAYKLLERVDRSRLWSGSAVDGSKNVGEDSLRIRFGHFGLTAQRLAPPNTALPPKSNPHPMSPVLPSLQAAFLKSLSTHSFVSFLRQRR